MEQQRITLATLAQATPQQVFDQVAEHLMTQMKKSTPSEHDTYSCMYRGPNGLMCAAGCLIGDEEYKPEWENKTWRQLAEKQEVPAEHNTMIRQLQFLHDTEEVCRWQYQLRLLAAEFNLSPAILEKQS